ncbi:DUF3068 domain-containing protein [Tomitella cavernea]|uniref:DUF3068 domain-containing protein n=1 Tax=Tomitella cavernea TaxID=1387982 RepID=A0ABP9D3Y0_9ACTN|nr:DUF3068 domain-containing protein [Tomitella cavernea]
MAKKRLGSAGIVACILIGLGVFLVVVAIMLPTYTKSKALKTPLDLHVETVATGKGAVLDASSLVAGAPEVAHDVPLKAVRNVTVQDPSNADIITVQAGQRLLRTDKPAPKSDAPTARDPRLINATVDKVTLDRVTSMPINNPESPNGVWTDAGGQMDPVPREGLQYKFPFDVEKKSYPYFDLTSRTTHPIDFAGEEEIDGMTVYHFTQDIAPVDLSKTVGGTSDKLTIPAEALGVTGEGDVEVHRFYTNQRDLWVDPVTGVIVKGREVINQYFARSADDDARITALSISPETGLTFDQNTIDYQLQQARDGQDKIELVTFTIPLIAGIVGALVLLAGLILGFLKTGRSGRRDDDRHEPPTEQIPTY